MSRTKIAYFFNNTSGRRQLSDFQDDHSIKILDAHQATIEADVGGDINCTVVLYRVVGKIRRLIELEWLYKTF